jgi:WD40 repeat protein
VWQSEDWDAEPELMPAQNAIKRIAWSPDGRFIAGATLDRCLLVGEIDLLADTWIVRGFPARIEQLAWLDLAIPTIVTISAEALVAWTYADEAWTALPPDLHRDPIAAISVHPSHPLVATASTGGEIAIWEPERGATGILTNINVSFTQIAWHPHDRTLITGCEGGDVTIWG